MKVLLLTSYRDSWPYIPELRQYLLSASITADVLDMFNMEYVSDKHKKFFCGSLREKILGPVPILNRFVKLILFPFFFFGKAKNIIQSYDIVNIHYVSLPYRTIYRTLRSWAQRLIITVWGSDFFRISDSHRISLKPIFNVADTITFLNPEMKNEFVKFYNNFSEKISIARFGLRSISIIDMIKHKEQKNESKQRLQIPANSFVITLGYSGSPAQQHERMISEIQKVALPQHTVLIIPMTYASTATYREHIRHCLEQSKIPFRILESRLSDDDVARLRIVSDVVINFQKSDQLSASLQEHLYAGNIMIAADWLPYSIFTNQGIRYIRSSWEQMPINLRNVFDHLEETRDTMKDNTKCLYTFSSWETNGPQWITLYQKTFQT